MNRAKQRRHSSVGVFAAGACLFAISAEAQVCNVQPAFPDGTVTNVMDRDRMMCQVGVQFPVLPLRLDDPNKPANAWPRDPNNPEGNWTDSRGHTVVRTSFGLWHTYDSDQGLAGGAMTGFGDYGPYSSPRYTDIDLFDIRKPSWLNPKRRVELPEDWWLLQRPQIEDSVQYHLYGRPIPKFPVNWVVSGETTGVQVVNGVSYQYRQKTLTGTVDKSSYPELRNTPVISAQCRIPAATGKRHPVVVTYGEGVARFQYTAPYDFGVCSYAPTQVQPDNGNNGALSSYLIGLMNKGDWRKPDDAGSLVAWGWGVSRLIDQLENDPDIDGDRVAVEGHSRYGKATLVTAAYDDRVVVAWPSDAGAMGTAMARRHYGESLEFVASASSEYHWVNGNIMKFAGPANWGGYLPRKVEHLKVDAHSTTALLAPRAIFVTNGTDTPPGNGDAWADPRGTWLSGHLASKVWELMGWKGQVIPEGTVFTSGIDESIGGTPPFNVAFLEGTVAWRRQIEGHTPVPNWPSFALFASRYLHDNRPVIAGGQEFRIDQGSGNDIGAVQASDQDAGDTLQGWQVKGGSGAYLVSIDKDSGVLKVIDAAALAKADLSKVRLTLMVGDGKRPSKDAEVIVTLPKVWQMCGAKNGAPHGVAVNRAQVPHYLSQGYTVGNCTL